MRSAAPVSDSPQAAVLFLVLQGVRDHIPRFTWQAIGRRLAFILTDTKHYPKPQVRFLFRVHVTAFAENRSDSTFFFVASRIMSIRSARRMEAKDVPSQRRFEKFESSSY